MVTERDEALFNRVIGLEEKYSFQEDTLQQLNDVVARQGLQILALAAQLQSCKEHLEGLRERGTGEGEAAIDERPPHY